MSLCISVCVHAVTCVHPRVTVHAIVYVHVYVCTCCCLDLRLLCVSTGRLSVVFVHVQYMLTYVDVHVACPCLLLVDFMYMYVMCIQGLYECLLVTPRIGRSSPDHFPCVC